MKRTGNQEFKILHVDGDGFFASCEVSRRPDLKGKPVVVGEERGIASAMSYEAKRLGITRGMPIFKVRQEFPQVTILSSHFELYEQFASALYSILAKHFANVEWYSIDECFAEVPLSYMERFGSWEVAIGNLKKEIQGSLGITYSFGVADTKVLAKVASKLNKPDGLTILREADRVEVLARTPIGSIWGIGYRSAQSLDKLGIKTALDFINYPVERIKSRYAEPILAIWHELHGTRLHSVHTSHDAKKSMQATRSFAPASNDPEFLFSELSRNIEIACRRLRAQGLATKTFGVFLKPKLKLKARSSAQITLPEYTQNPSDLLRAVREVFTTELFNERHLYRATGVSVFGLVDKENIPEDLFGKSEAKQDRDSYLLALDKVSEKCGAGSIFLGSSMRSITKRSKEFEARNAKDNYIANLPLPYMGEVY